MLVKVQDHSLRKIVAMLKSSGLILQLTGGIGPPVGGGFMCVKKVIDY